MLKTNIWDDHIIDYSQLQAFIKSIDNNYFVHVILTGTVKELLNNISSLI